MHANAAVPLQERLEYLEQQITKHPVVCLNPPSSDEGEEAVASPKQGSQSIVSLRFMGILASEAAMKSTGMGSVWHTSPGAFTTNINAVLSEETCF